MNNLPSGPSDGEITIHVVDWKHHCESLSLVRRQVFIEEQGVPKEMEWDEDDLTAVHFLASDHEGHPVATARLQHDGKVGRMAVLKPHRRQGIGSAMMNRVIAEAADRQVTLYLHAQQSAESFYLRFGFQLVGNPFDEAGIAHVRMQLPGKI